MKHMYVILSVLFLSISSSLFPQSQNKSVFLVYGGTGWIGGKLLDLLNKKDFIAVAGTARIENRQDVEREITQIQPDYVLNAAGLTGRPNVDWCEDHKQETVRANILGALNLADICYIHNIPMTNFGTGCIYEYDEKHPMYSGIGFTEEDEPNFDGSFYSKSKIMLDKMLRIYPNVLNLRLRMPISDDLHPRSFITKIIGYKKVINIPNSMTVLTDLLPISIDMTLGGFNGTFNFVNPGTISHNEILDLYTKYIKPDFTYLNFTVEEQNQILKARRSNNELDTAQLLHYFPHIPHIKESIIGVFERMKENIQ